MTLARYTPNTLPHRSTGYTRRALRLVHAALGVVLALGCAAPAWAQRAEGYEFYNSNMPPGTIGRERLILDASLRGYFQPVLLTAPKGTRVSLAQNGQFEVAQPAPRLVGLLVGHVYRLKVTNIPLNEGLEVYPTIELIDRLYPPRGQIERFPVPIDLTKEELEMALSGRYVMRVIYLEDPTTAIPLAEPATEQRHFEAGPGEDPLHAAEQLGRPMAILRMGSRMPDERDRQVFFFGSPPVRKYGADALERLLNPKGAPEAVPAPGAGGEAAPKSAQSGPGQPAANAGAPPSKPGQSNEHRASPPRSASVAGPVSGRGSASQGAPQTAPRSRSNARPGSATPNDAASDASTNSAPNDAVRQFESQFSSRTDQSTEPLTFPGRIFRLATPPSEARGARR